MDVKEQELAYLQGKIEALEQVLNQLVGYMPDVALEGLAQKARQERKWMTEERDADPEHRRWSELRWLRTEETKTPTATLYSSGYLDVMEPLDEQLSELLDDREKGARVPLIAASEEGLVNARLIANWAADET